MENAGILKSSSKPARVSLTSVLSITAFPNDALTAHVAMIFTRYMLMSVTKRDDEDERTLGELFYFMVDEVADITFSQSMKILLDAMLASVRFVFRASEEQITAFTNDFISRLPKYVQKPLLTATTT